MATLTLIATAFGLGLLFNAAPGPVFAATVQVGVRGGFKPALAVQFGSIVGDGVWAVLGLVGVGLLLELTSLRLAIGIAGVGYLLWLAWQSWRASRQEFALEGPPATTSETRRAWRAGVTLSLTNPQNVAYWAVRSSRRARARRRGQPLRTHHLSRVCPRVPRPRARVGPRLVAIDAAGSSRRARGTPGARSRGPGQPPSLIRRHRVHCAKRR
jgi:hypothetical protein